MATEELPIEIITTILSYLPVKPLCRFKSVSKPWYSLINSPSFIKLHLSNSTLHPRHLIVSHPSCSPIIAAVDDAALSFSQFNHPVKSLPEELTAELMGSCNGVVLITTHCKKFVYLSNPITGSNCLLPPAPSPPEYRYGSEVFGFGYDSVSDDYKVVRMFEYAVHASGFPSNYLRECIEVWVYSLKNDSWHIVPADIEVGIVVFLDHAVLVDGTLYFNVNQQIGLEPEIRIKCFDLASETFSLVDFPHVVNASCLEEVSMKELKGRLCVLTNHQERVDRKNRQLVFAELWEMRKEGWVKLCRFPKLEGFDRCEYLRLVTCSNDGRRILIQVDGVWFGWYDLETNKFEEVAVTGLRPKGTPYLTCTFVESLVPLAKTDSIPAFGVAPMEEGAARMDLTEDAADGN